MGHAAKMQKSVLPGILARRKAEAGGAGLFAGEGAGAGPGASVVVVEGLQLHVGDVEARAKEGGSMDVGLLAGGTTELCSLVDACRQLVQQCAELLASTATAAG